MKINGYSDVPETLQTLKRRGFRLAIPSSRSPAMREGAAKSSGLQNVFDRLLPVGEARIYKLDPRACRPAEAFLQDTRCPG